MKVAILRQMPNQLLLDRTFHAMANATRRGVIVRLGTGPASMTDLAQDFDMAMPSLLQHLQTLERDGMVHSTKTGRVRLYRLESAPLLAAEDWLVSRRAVWETRLNQLDAFLALHQDNQP